MADGCHIESGTYIGRVQISASRMYRMVHLNFHMTLASYNSVHHVSLVLITSVMEYCTQYILEANTASTSTISRCSTSLKHSSGVRMVEYLHRQAENAMTNWRQDYMAFGRHILFDYNILPRRAGLVWSPRKGLRNTRQKKVFKEPTHQRHAILASTKASSSSASPIPNTFSNVFLSMTPT